MRLLRLCLVFIFPVRLTETRVFSIWKLIKGNSVDVSSTFYQRQKGDTCLIIFKLLEPLRWKTKEIYEQKESTPTSESQEVLERENECDYRTTKKETQKEKINKDLQGNSVLSWLTLDIVK